MPHCFSDDKNCNETLDKILEQIKKMERPYNFFFIDPFKMDFSWESMRKILGIRSDILLTFMSRIAWRFFWTNKSTGHGHKKLTQLFGDESWRDAKNEEDLVRIYVANIVKEREDAVVLTTKINSTKGFTYHLIFITHQTSSKNPWLKPILNARREIEKNSDNAIKSIMDVIKNRQTELLDF